MSSSILKLEYADEKVALEKLYKEEKETQAKIKVLAERVDYLDRLCKKEELRNKQLSKDGYSGTLVVKPVKVYKLRKARKFRTTTDYGLTNVSAEVKDIVLHLNGSSGAFLMTDVHTLLLQKFPTCNVPKTLVSTCLRDLYIKGIIDKSPLKMARGKMNAYAVKKQYLLH